MPNCDFKGALEEAKSQQLTTLESLALRAKSAIATIRNLGVESEFFTTESSGSGAGGSAAGSGGASFRSVPDLPTMLIGEALDFVRKRAKEEALRLILEKMDKELCVKDGGEELLPSFCTLLGQVHNPRCLARSLYTPSCMPYFSDKNSPQTGQSVCQENLNCPSCLRRSSPSQWQQ